MYERQVGRQSVGGDYRRVIIDEVRPSSSFVSAHGQRGETYRISFDFHQPLVAVPLKNELWNIKMIGDGWYLDRKADTTNLITNLEAGDSRIDAGNDLFLSASETIHIDAGGVIINGIPSGYHRRVEFITTATALGDWGRFYLVSAAAPYTITLQTPTASNQGQTATFKKIDNNANVITLIPATGTIDGSATYTGLNALNKYITLVSDGNNTWYNIASN